MVHTATRENHQDGAAGLRMGTVGCGGRERCCPALLLIDRPPLSTTLYKMSGKGRESGLQAVGNASTSGHNGYQGGSNERASCP